MDEREDMRRRGKPQTEGASSVDAELHARLSRLRSELVQSRRAVADKALGVALILIRHAARFRGNATTLSGTATS